MVGVLSTVELLDRSGPVEDILQIRVAGHGERAVWDLLAIVQNTYLIQRVKYYNK